MAAIQAIGRACRKPIRSLKVPSSWRRSPRKEEDCIRSPTARVEQTIEKQVPSPKTEFEMCNPKASCSHKINETGECVAAVKDIENTLREQSKQKPEVLSPYKWSDDFVEIHISISAGNCQGDSRRVEDGARNKNTSNFSKPKKSYVSTKESNQFRSDGRLHICLDWPGDSEFGSWPRRQEDEFGQQNKNQSGKETSGCGTTDRDEKRNAVHQKTLEEDNIRHWSDLQQKNKDPKGTFVLAKRPEKKNRSY
jgi:hypothetical protein